MPTTSLRQSLSAAAGLAAFALGAGCTPGSGPLEPPPLSTTSPAEVAPAKGAEPMDRAFRALAPLDSDQRSRLGLPPTGFAIDAASLLPLTAEQWADPAAVSARLVLLQTNYRAGEDPAQVRARWTPFLVERMAEDLAASGGAAAPAEFRAVDAVLVGDVVGLTVVERSSRLASVALTVRRTVLSGGQAIRRTRIDFWLVETVLDPDAGRWLVAAVERS